MIFNCILIALVQLVRGCATSASSSASAVHPAVQPPVHPPVMDQLFAALFSSLHELLICWYAPISDSILCSAFAFCNHCTGNTKYAICMLFALAESHFDCLLLLLYQRGYYGSNFPRAEHNISLVLWSTLEQTMLLYHCCIYLPSTKKPPFQRNGCISHHITSRSAILCWTDVSALSHTENPSATSWEASLHCLFDLEIAIAIEACDSQFLQLRAI